METNINEIEILYKRTTMEYKKISSSKDACSVFREVYNQHKNQIDLKEYFYVLYLSRANEVIGVLKISEGTNSSTTVDTRFIIGTGIKTVASAIVICHNHPSGNLKPSSSDIQLTERITKGCKLFDIRLLDHLILTRDTYFSFADEGLI